VYDEDKQDAPIDIVDKINADREIKEKELEATRLNTIHQMELNKSNAEKEQKKIDALNQMIDTRINPLKELTLENSQKIDGIIGELQKIGSYLQQTIPQKVAPADEAKGLLQQLPPEMAANVLNGLLTGVAQLVQAWKSGNHSEPNQFAQMSQEITTNLLRAGVDGIMQNVYHNYNPNPPKPSWQNPQPTQNHTLE